MSKRDEIRIVSIDLFISKQSKPSLDFLRALQRFPHIASTLRLHLFENINPGSLPQEIRGLPALYFTYNNIQPMARQGLKKCLEWLKQQKDGYTGATTGAEFSEMALFGGGDGSDSIFSNFSEIGDQTGSSIVGRDQYDATGKLKISIGDKIGNINLEDLNRQRNTDPLSKIRAPPPGSSIPPPLKTRR